MDGSEKKTAIAALVPKVERKGWLSKKESSGRVPCRDGSDGAS